MNIELNICFHNDLVNKVRSVQCLLIMSSKKLMIVDTDCGIDDALALVMVLGRPEWEILAVTCVAGNVELQKVCPNVLRVLNLCHKKDIKVYKGCDKALVNNNFKACQHHHIDGFGGVASEFSTGNLKFEETPHASIVILDLVKKHPNEITLVALGPLTNLALCNRLDPNFTTYIKQLIIMGGNIDARGNIMKCSEFNFAFDPEAAQMIVTEAVCPVRILPWETCFRHSVQWEWFDKWVQIDTPKGHLAQKITAEASYRVRHILGRTAFCCCDLLAMATIVQPEIIKKQIKRCVEVELHGQHTRGMMLVERRPAALKDCLSNVEIVKEVDMEKLKMMYTEMLEH
ncbi:nucleoside hydrolase-like [Centruroides vittatus]|uniref:nucleoside hydrolase-like n=1 Tax=Centruroides vittatus TaxID=120091 RepID=UPI003510A6F8